MAKNSHTKRDSAHGFWCCAGCFRKQNIFVFIPFTGSRDLLLYRPSPLDDTVVQGVVATTVSEKSITVEIAGKIGTADFNLDAWWKILEHNLNSTNSYAEKFNNRHDPQLER